MAQRRFEYKVELSGSEGFERMLNEYGEQGWRVVTVDFHSSVVETVDGVKLSIILFEREKS
jgi:hypothetical protein